MDFSSGVGLLFGVACLASFIAPLTKKQPYPEKPFNHLTEATAVLKNNLSGLLVALAGGLLLLASGATTGIAYFLGAFIGSWLLSAFLPHAGLRGTLLLITAALLFGKTNLPIAAYDSTPLIAPFSFLFGLITSRFPQNKPDASDYLIPAVWLIGHLWIALSAPEAAQPLQQNLLLVILSITLLLRAFGESLLLPKGQVLQSLFLIITGGLGAWFAIQSLLFQPALLSWAALYAGGLLLGFLLTWDNPAIKSHSPTLSGLIQLILIGLGALVASRLFGTLGWVILGAGILVFSRSNWSVTLGVLFFLSRALLQTFIFQFNPNVTGINITHPYASAALFAGFAAMLALPELFKLFKEEPERADASASLSCILLTLAWLPVGALSIYFLHAEATGSLLTALTIAGLGMGLMGQWPQMQVQSIQPAPLLFSTIVINSALLAGNLLETGNTAEKSQKLLALFVALAFYAVLFAFTQRKAPTSGGKPVEIA